MKIGSITLQVIRGDITKEDTEVIVNLSNSSFDAKTGIILNMQFLSNKSGLVFRKGYTKELSTSETFMKCFSDDR